MQDATQVYSTVNRYITRQLFFTTGNNQVVIDHIRNKLGSRCIILNCRGIADGYISHTKGTYSAAGKTVFVGAFYSTVQDNWFSGSQYMVCRLQDAINLQGISIFISSHSYCMCRLDGHHIAGARFLCGIGPGRRGCY
ncbi:hypothetical protein D9M68_828000 [compost metagenome]